MPTHALSGTRGSLLLSTCTILTVTDFEITYGSPPEEYFSVGGQGAALTVATAERGSGTINTVIDPNGLLGSHAGTGDLIAATFTCTSGITLTGNIRLGQPSTTVDLAGGPQRQSWPFTCEKMTSSAGLI